MKLTKIYFDAFKSLLNKELEITDSCMGLVGTNESGKSNILSAVYVLGHNRKLSAADTPKMAKHLNPTLRFKFELTSSENRELIVLIDNWRKDSTPPGITLGITNLDITYKISLNKITNVEERSFLIEGFSLDNNCRILRYDKLDNYYKIKFGDEFIPLKQAIIIREAHMLAHNQYLQIFKEIEKVERDIIKIEELISNQAQRLPPEMKESNLLKEILIESKELNTDEIKDGHLNLLITLSNEEIKKLNSEIKTNELALADLKKKKESLELKVSNYNVSGAIVLNQKYIDLEQRSNIRLNKDIAETENKIIEFTNLASITDEQKTELQTLEQNLVAMKADLLISEARINDAIAKINSLNEPLQDKYTKDIRELDKHFKLMLENFLQNLLPKVVFWEHSPNYILQSETLFANILDKNNFFELSRPLINVFRIGFGIRDIESLKSKIDEIQKDSNERSKVEKAINKKINQYVKSVWKDYRQSLKITLEEHQIRIEIFDPDFEEASYYNMEERSQGCQTFLSFLMTIGAEAEEGVITNNILLLDEPETHLHPSGVRFMLQELIKISEKGNLVIYATHSIFLIDRSNYNRHIILEKVQEVTLIKPSSRGRIGYFMQEEVLYNTLDLNLGTDFSSSNRFNFVFEGDADAAIFEYFYDKILSKTLQPFQIDNSSFYQGGKCSDIQKYFSYRPIQLGTKWIFILDRDKPADDLKKFIEGKYRNYIDTDIYVFQYKNEKKKTNKIYEFEDLLPLKLISDSYLQVNKELALNLKENEISKLVTEDENFVKYNDAITKLVKENVKEVFKGKLKEIINLNVKQLLSNEDSAERFVTEFPDYHKWVSEVINSLQTKITNNSG